MDYGIIVDLETTGLNPKEDRIIEVGLFEFVVDGDFRAVLTRTYSGLEDPGIEIPTEVTAVTGIATEHVAGRHVDWNLVRDFFSQASVVIAHNAPFDRGFIERCSKMTDIKTHWACSLRHIDWRRHGFRNMALNYLAADHGFVNPFAHRALFDCATTFRLVSPYLRELIERSYEREYRLLAVGAPFEAKDLLKERGYRWDGEARVWGKIIAESGLEAERAFLGEKVYGGNSRHKEEELV